jgi:hypothetical protein
MTYTVEAETSNGPKLFPAPNRPAADATFYHLRLNCKLEGISRLGLIDGDGEVMREWRRK